MALTNKEKQQAFRDRNKKKGLKKREFYLSEKNFKKVKEYIKTI